MEITLDNGTYIFNTLTDKRNWISEYTKIKSAIPKNFVEALRHENIHLQNAENGDPKLASISP